MSSKAGIAVVLVVLLVFCLIAAVVGGFLGWRYYSKKGQVTEVTNVNATPPPPIETATQPIHPPAVTGGETSSAGTTTPSTNPSSHHVVSGTPTSSHSSPPPAASRSTSSTRSSTASSENDTTLAETTKNETPAETEIPTPEEKAPTTPKKVKKPHGQLGLIFESRIDAGKLSILIDGRNMVEQSYTASSSSPFRLEKQVKMSVGEHFVKVTISTPDGKTYDQGWNVMIQRRAVTVWKIQMDRFPKKITIKHIQ